MIQARRSRHYDAPPSVVFAALADPDKLATLLPRVRQIEFLERSATGARIVTHMAFGPFGDIRSEGTVHWQNDREIVFQSQSPAAIEARWTLTPADSGTDVSATLSLDLAPILGPLAGLIPPDQVINMLEPDLDTALDELGRRLANLQ